MEFGGFDPVAEVRIEGSLLIIRFRFSDEVEAQDAAAELKAAYLRGEDVTITLSSPGAGELQ